VRAAGPKRSGWCSPSHSLHCTGRLGRLTPQKAGGRALSGVHGVSLGTPGKTQ
jgi:hypothetical protein